MFKWRELKQIQGQILDWYERESSKKVFQSRVEDVQQSEKVRIFHHEQHQKQYKKSSILNLDTEAGILRGHAACSTYLTNKVVELLEHEAVLDPNA